MSTTGLRWLPNRGTEGELTGQRSPARRLGDGNPLRTGEDKAGADRGRYLRPEAHGRPAENSVMPEVQAAIRQHLSRDQA
jgi:hypothetical protein